MPPSSASLPPKLSSGLQGSGSSCKGADTGARHVAVPPVQGSAHARLAQYLHLHRLLPRGLHRSAGKSLRAAGTTCKLLIARRHCLMPLPPRGRHGERRRRLAAGVCLQGAAKALRARGPPLHSAALQMRLRRWICSPVASRKAVCGGQWWQQQEDQPHGPSARHGRPEAHDSVVLHT